MAQFGKAVINVETKLDQASMNAAGSKLNANATRMGNSIRNILSGAIGAAFLASSFKGERDLERALRQVSVIGDDINLNKVRKQAESLSEIFGGDAVESVNAFYQAVSAGFTKQGAAETLTKAATGLAAIGAKGSELMSAEDAMNLLTTALNSYGLDATHAEEASDALFKTIQFGKTTADQLAQSFSTAAPMASALGISMDDLLAATSSLTQVGFQTSKAFVGIRQVLKEGAKENTAVGKAIRENLGMSLIEATQSGMSFAEILRDGILPAVQGNNAELINLFGNVRGGSAAMALTNGGMKKFTETLDKFKNSTNASSNAIKKFSASPITSFDGALQKVKNTVFELINGVGGIGNAVIILGTIFSAFKIASFISKIMQAVAALSAMAIAKTASQTGVGAIAAVPAVIGAIGAGIAAVGAIAGTAVLGSKINSGGSGGTPINDNNNNKNNKHESVVVNVSVDPITGRTTMNNQATNIQLKT